MSVGMSWRHSVVAADQLVETSKLGDFFKKGLPAHLVREVSQNTMDNRRGDERAELSFRFVTLPRPAKFEPYLKDLRRHVVASGAGDSSVDWDHPSLLLIEDFGTKGLEGPIDDRHANGSFAKFWHRTGDSNKGQGSSKGGRHGVGKVVNAEASRVRAYFGYSVRDNGVVRSTLLGRSYLKPHRLRDGGEDLHGLGTFHKGEPGKPIAALFNEDADDFADIVQLARRPDSPGLSLVVLWPREDITPASIKQAVLRECLYQVTADQLSVRIDDEVIDASTIRAALQADPKLSALLPLHDLIEAAAKPSRIWKPLEVIEPGDEKTYLSKSSFELTALEGMRADWQQGLPVIVDAQLRLRPKNANDKIVTFRVALQIADEAHSAIACIRDDVNVRGAVRWGKRPAVALLLAAESALSGFLGDAEGPSHEDWEYDYVKDAYVRARETIAAVKRALVGVYDALLATESDELVTNALLEFFSWQAPAGKKKPKPIPKPKPKIEVPSRPPLFNLTRTKDGFTVTAANGAASAGPFDLTVKCAYAVRFGDAFKEYVEYDFDLKKLPGLEIAGVQSSEVAGNSIKVKGADANLRIHVSGLDPKRDLEVKVRAQGVEAAEGAP